MSKEKNNSIVYPSFFASTKHLKTCVGVAVLDVKGDEVDAIFLKPDGYKRKIVEKRCIENSIAHNELEFVEKLPKHIATELLLMCQ